MKPPELDPDKKQKEKAPTERVLLPSPPIVEAKTTSPQKVEAFPPRRLTNEQEKQTSEQDPRVKDPTLFNQDKGTSEQDKTLADIAEQISLAQSAVLQEEEEVKKGSKRREILESGKIFQSKYEIIRMIGSGGMGQVYVANHITLASKVAIKVLNTNFIGDDDEEAVERFKREAQATARVDHLNAVKVFDFGAEDNICYLVMEFLNGESLRKRLSRAKRLPIPEVVNLIEQVCSVLEVMHRKGIVHRDLKPDNIFFHNQEDREVVKVLDFGIAKVAGSTLSEGKLTGTGALLGTPHYMSPEQCQGMKLDGRSDLYSFGIIVYELLSGTLPFEAENTLSMLFKHVRDNPVDIRKVIPDLPQPIADIVMRALEKNPKNRYQTAKEYSQAFCEAVQAQTITTSTEAKNSSTITIGKTSDLDIRETIETAMFPKMEGNLDEDIQEEDKNKQYDVSTRSHQPAATRPIGRVAINDNSPINKDVYKDVPAIQNQNIEIKPSSLATNPLAKYAIPAIALVLIFAIFGVWKISSNFQTNPTTNAVTTPINTASQPTQKDILLKENFVLIPATTAKIGTNGSDKDCKYVPDCKIEDFEKPSHEVKLGAYFINKYEVTNAEYYQFTKETGYEIPPNWDKETKQFPSGMDKLPVNQINWQDAQAYCNWRKKKTQIDFRLPTEQEWEYAARGSSEALFPWGNDWDESFVYGAKPADRIKNPASIDVPPNNSSDRSPFGIFAMGGNVAEWTDSNFAVYPNSPYEKKVTELDKKCKVVRGGSFNAAPTDLRVTSRAWYEPNKKDSNIGFRLAVSAKGN